VRKLLCVVPLLFLVGCTQDQKQKTDAVITKACTAIIDNADAAKKATSLGVKTLLTNVAKEHPKAVKDAATALSQWADVMVQLLEGKVDIAGSAWKALLTGLGDKLPAEVKIVGTLAIGFLDSVGTVSVDIPLKLEQKQASVIVLWGIKEGADTFLSGL